MSDMSGKVAVVTGAMRGVGLGIAREMIDAGATVVITDIDQTGLDEAVADLGPRASGLVADVTDLAAVERAYAEVVRMHGRLDAVVANAGVGDSAPLGSITERQFDFIFGVNVKGVLFTVQAALPHLSHGGTAVIVGSTASTRSEYGMSLYGGSKAALRQMVRTWIRELEGSGIRQHREPGRDRHPLAADRAGRIPRRGPRRSPGGRDGQEDSSFITGVELFTDGGMAQTG